MCIAAIYWAPFMYLPLYKEWEDRSWSKDIKIKLSAEGKQETEGRERLAGSAWEEYANYFLYFI